MPSNLDIDASAERLLPSATATPAPCGVLVKAGPGNSTNIIYVGFTSTVTAGTDAALDGYPLAVGEEWLIPPSLIPGGDAANIYVIGSAANLKAFYYIIPYVPAPTP